MKAQRITMDLDLAGNFVINITERKFSITLDEQGNILYLDVCQNGYDSNRPRPRLHHTRKGRISKLDNLKIEYDFFTKNISQIDNLKIEYDFHSGRISKAGKWPLKYDFRTERICQIGNVAIKYDFRNDMISEIGNIKFQYAPFSTQLERVGNSDFEYEFDNITNRNFLKRGKEGRHRCTHNEILEFHYEGIDFYIRL